METKFEVSPVKSTLTLNEKFYAFHEKITSLVLQLVEKRAENPPSTLHLHEQVELAEGIQTIKKLNQIINSMIEGQQELLQDTHDSEAAKHAKIHELLMAHYEELKKFLADRWELIQGTILEYTERPWSEANQLCNEIAHWMWPLPQNVEDYSTLQSGEGPYFLLMPSLQACADNNGDNIHTLRLNQFILSSPRDKYIPVLSTLLAGNLSNDPIPSYKHSVSGNWEPLNDEEIKRLTQHSNHTKGYVERIDYYKKEQRKSVSNTLYQALNLLSYGLYAGGAKALTYEDGLRIKNYALEANLDLNDLLKKIPGKIDEAGQIALEAAYTFFTEVWNTYSLERRLELYRNYPGEGDVSLNTILTELARIFAMEKYLQHQEVPNDNMHTRPCVETLAANIQYLLRKSPQLKEEFLTLATPETKREAYAATHDKEDKDLTESLNKADYRPIARNEVSSVLLLICLRFPSRNLAFTPQYPTFLMLCLQDKRYFDRLPLLVEYSPIDDFLFNNSSGVNVLDIAKANHQHLLPALFKRLVTLDEKIQTKLLEYQSKRLGVQYQNLLQLIEAKHPEMLMEVLSIIGAQPTHYVEKIKAEIKLRNWNKAVSTGNVSEMLKFIATGIDVNRPLPYVDLNKTEQEFIKSQTVYIETESLSPLNIAICKRNKEMFALLLKHEAKINCDGKFQTLQIALRNTPEFVPFLLLHILKMDPEVQRSLFVLEDGNILNYIYKYYPELLKTIEAEKDLYHLQKPQSLQLTALLKQDFLRNAFFKAIEACEFKTAEQLILEDKVDVNLSTVLIQTIYNCKNVENAFNIVKFLFSQENIDLFHMNSKRESLLSYMFQEYPFYSDLMAPLKSLFTFMLPLSHEKRREVMQDPTLNFSHFRNLKTFDSEVLLSILHQGNIFKNEETRLAARFYFRKLWSKAVEEKNIYQIQLMINVFPEVLYFIVAEHLLRVHSTAIEYCLHDWENTTDHPYTKPVVLVLLSKQPINKPIHIRNKQFNNPLEAILTLPDNTELLKKALEVAACSKLNEQEQLVGKGYKTVIKYAEAEHPSLVNHLLSLKDLQGDEAIMSVRRNQQLLVCAQNNDVQGAKQLLEEKADVQVKDSEANTPLVHAILRGHVEMFHLLVHNNSHVYPENKDIINRAMGPNAKPVLPHLFAFLGVYSLDQQKEFLTSAGVPNTCIFEFVIEKYPEYLHTFLASPSSKPVKGDGLRKKILIKHIESLIMQAVNTKDGMLFSLLMNEDINISTHSIGKMNALMLAMQHGNEAVIQTVLTDKNSLLIRIHDKNVFDYACKHPKLPYLTDLLSKALKFTPEEQRDLLERTEYSNVLDFILNEKPEQLPAIISKLNDQDLAELKTALQTLDENDNSYLMLAVKSTNKHKIILIQCLIELGLPLDIRNQAGSNVLDFARYDREIMPILLAAVHKLSVDVQQEMLSSFYKNKAERTQYVDIKDYQAAKFPCLNLESPALTLSRPKDFMRTHANRFLIASATEQKEEYPKAYQSGMVINN